MELKNSNFAVKIDETNGATSSIVYPADKTQMNWVFEKLAWGTIPEYNFVAAEQKGNCVKVIYENAKNQIQVTVEKTVTATEYFEKYIITNVGQTEFFLTKDNFGILIPTNCNFKKGGNLMNKCISHIWCGINVCWLYSKCTNGKKPYLVMNLTEGAVEDYSIDYDYSLTRSGADWRGAFLLHPKECVVKPQDSIVLNFRYRFTDETPEIAPLDFDGAMRFTASKYSLNIGEKVKVILEYNGNLQNAEIICDGKSLPYTVVGDTVCCELSFDTLGEHEIKALVDGKETFLRIKVIDDLAQMLQKRAHFIAEKQQYLCDGSHLDGAYLIYDNETGKQYYNTRDDHNASRERICMGIVVCRALQQKYSDTLMASLKKHREFVEREVFDTHSGMVYNEICKGNNWLRIFNFPWIGVYYLEWYNLTGEKQCLEYAARALLKYYELNGNAQDSQCIEAVRTLDALKKEGLNDLYSSLFDAFIDHADQMMIRSGICKSEEIVWVNEMPSNVCGYLSQAYILTGDEKYIKEAKVNGEKSKVFYAYQPDFHQNCVAVRYWDSYWFGKIRSYGDVFPHYWSALTGWAFSWYDRASGNENRQIIQNNLTGNLCIYEPDGAANNCYLYPYRIDMYTSDPMHKDQFMKTGTTYGKRYDPWANDQDWALYYASLFL